jgi:hypothetical protein
MKKLLLALLVGASVLHVLARPLSAQTGCEGTSGSANIDGTPWTASCVIAASAPDCVDSLGGTYECFQILGAGDAQSIAIFLAEVPAQGQTYALGGVAANAAMLIGDTGLWFTGEAPYTGEVHITSYAPGSSTLECTFFFEAQSLFPGPADASITDGTFVGRLVAVEEKTWSDVKLRYRD